MTSDQSPLDQHPDLDVLADIADGLAVDAVVTAHVAACVDCRELTTALARTRSELDALPALTMPADVAAALDARLASEGSASAPAAGVTLLPAQGTRRTSWFARHGGALAGAAAAAVLVLLGTGVVLGTTHKSPNRTPGEAAGVDTTAGNRAGATSPPIFAASGREYTDASFQRNVNALVAGTLPHTTIGLPLGFSANTASASAAPSGPSGAAAPQTQKDALGLPADLTGCLAELTGDPAVQPLAVDVARYAGQPALIVVIPDSPKRLGVYVVRTTCRAGNSDLITFRHFPWPGH